MWVRVDGRADLGAAKTELSHATLELARGEVGILQRDRPEAAETIWIRAHDFGDVIVEPSGKVQRVRRFCPIAEHDRHGGKDLHGDAGSTHFFDAPRWFPNVVRDFTKDAIADHHSRAARLVMFQSDESRITVLRVEIGPLAREDVSVEIDLHKNMVGTPRCGVHGHRSAMSLPRTA